MKLFFLILSLFASSYLLAQQDLLQQRINMRVFAMSQTEALKKLELESGLTLAYPSSLIDPNQKLKLDFEEEKLETIIQRIFEGKKIQMRILGKRLLIKEQKPPSSDKKTINGYIKDKKSGEMLIGADIFLQNNSGTSTNAYGYFSLSLAPGHYQLTVSYLGYESISYTIELTGDQRKDFLLTPNTTQLEAVIVTSATDNTVEDNNSGSRHKLHIPSLKKLPAIGGEPDLFKSIQFLPGVNSAGEGSTGLYVRGGNIDQNLIMLDEAPIYNPSHLLGFFSTFHPDAIHHMEVYKGNFPARYGGRLSSVADLRMKEGNKESFKVQGGIGLLASRLMLEGPIQKNQHSFMLAARRTYPDLFLRADEDDGGNKINFLDVNFKTNWTLDKNNRLFLSMYNGQDVFRYFDAYENQWGNTTATLRWNRLFDEKTFANFSLIFSRYQYAVDHIIEGVETYNWTSGITDYNAKADFSTHINPRNRLNYGTQQILHQFRPGQESQQRLCPIPESKTLEQAFYISHQAKLNERLSLTYGFRISAAHNLGKGKTYHYDDDYNIIDSTNHSGGIFHSQYRWSPRIHIQFKSGPATYWSGGYSRTVQYLFQLRNTTTAFNAFYMFIPGNINIPAQAADQFSLSFMKKSRDRSFQWSIESYYKWLHQQIDFIDHAQLLQNPYVESEIRIGQGKAYGLETYIQKNGERWNGILSYSYSRSLRKIKGINNGKTYPTYYDQPHALKLGLQYNPRSRWEMALNWQLVSGRPTTLPIGSFRYEQTVVPVYGVRNSARLPVFHRLDLSITLNGKNKAALDKGAYWVLSVFNVYNRKNTLSIDIQPRQEKGSGNVPDPLDVAAFKTYISGIFPSLSYNFRF